MYQIYADYTLIYDSTMEDYKLSAGKITREVDKSGSFVFSIYPDHPYYDSFVRMRTVIRVIKSRKLVFRGRVLNDTTDYWGRKQLTCEGELGFLQDSVVRPFEFSGTPQELFARLIQQHNRQVDSWKQFKVGSCTVVDPNNYIARSSTLYEDTLSILTSRLPESTLGGHFYITHDDTDDLPTIHYLEDYPHTASQTIEFGVNLMDYTKKVNAADICTACVPLGATGDDGDTRLTIKSVNNGVDYVYNSAGVELYGWIFKTVEWDDVTIAANLLTKARAYVDAAASLAVTVELTAVDLHLLDRSIESYNVCDYVPISSKPHNFEATLLCTKQTMDLLQPANDTVTLGHSYASFSETGAKLASAANRVQVLQSNVSNLTKTVSDAATATGQNTESIKSLETQTQQNTANIQMLGDTLGGIGYVTGTFSCPALSSSSSYSDVTVTRDFGFTPSIVLFVDDSIGAEVTKGNIYLLLALSAEGFTVRCTPKYSSTVARTVRYIAFV